MTAVRRWLRCRFTRGNIDAYRDGEAPHLRERIEAHLRECARCRALADALAAQARAIEALPAQEQPPAGFVGRVMQRIEAASVRAARPAWRPALAGAFAAVVTIAALLWLVVARTPTPITPGAPTAAPVPTLPAPSQVAQMPPAVLKQQETAAAVTPTPAVKPSAAVSATRRSTKQPRPVSPTPAEVAARAQAYRDSGRAYENEGQLEEALVAYTAARDEGGSHMARLDVARVYEKSGYTAEALGELEQVAFAKLDDQRWEALIVD